MNDNDPLREARGVFNGVVLGLVLWTVILAAAYAINRAL